MFFCLQHMDKTLNRPGCFLESVPYLFIVLHSSNEMEIKHRWLKPSSTIVCFRGWKTSSWQQLGMLFWSLIFLQRQHNTSIHQKFKHSLFLHSSFYLLLLGSKKLKHVRNNFSASKLSREKGIGRVWLTVESEEAQNWMWTNFPKTCQAAKCQLQSVKIHKTLWTMCVFYCVCCCGFFFYVSSFRMAKRAQCSSILFLNLHIAR